MFGEWLCIEETHFVTAQTQELGEFQSIAETNVCLSATSRDSGGLNALPCCSELTVPLDKTHLLSARSLYFCWCPRVFSHFGGVSLCSFYNKRASSAAHFGALVSCTNYGSTDTNATLRKANTRDKFTVATFLTSHLARAISIGRLCHLSCLIDNCLCILRKIAIVWLRVSRWFSFLTKNYLFCTTPPFACVPGDIT